MLTILTITSLFLTACHHKSPGMPEAAITLGWRLAPGMEIRYDTHSVYSVGEDTIERQESWTYLVRAVDGRGNYALEAHITHLDASISHAGQRILESELKQAIAQERIRLDLSPVHLHLSMDGRMDSIEASRWSDTCPHRLLALLLPAHPILPGARWADPATARPLSHFTPSDVELKVSGTQQMKDLRWNRHRGKHAISALPTHLDAEIHTSAVVLPDDARFPAIEIDGDTEWNLDKGLMDHRWISIRLRGGKGYEETGSLFMEMWRRP